MTKVSKNYCSRSCTYSYMSCTYTLSTSSWSDTSLAITAAVCLTLGFALMSFAVYSALPSACTHTHHGQITPHKVNISGTYNLEEADENYPEYLLAMDIPHHALPYIITSDEVIVIRPLSPQENIINIKTITSWTTKEIEFEFNKQLQVSYGKGGSVFTYNCTRPQHNRISCRSGIKSKGWRFLFDFIFSDHSLMYQSYFVTKNIGNQKIYRRVVE